MAREHHCPNCGAQACNASTSKIHTCGVCAAIWEEDLSVPAPAPVAPKPAAPATTAAPAAAPKPAVPAPPATAPPKSAAPPASPGATAAASKPPTPTPAASPTPSPPAAPALVPASPAPAAPVAKPAPVAAPPGGKTLREVLAGAKVKRCPKCRSDGVAQPSDFRMAQGRTVLTDSQTYRAHEWYADTGEVLPPAARPPAAAAPPAPVPRTNPST